MYNRPFVWAWVVCAAQLMDADLNIMCGTVLRMECIVRIGTSVLMRTVPYVLLGGDGGWASGEVDPDEDDYPSSGGSNGDDFGVDDYW